LKSPQSGTFRFIISAMARYVLEVTYDGTQFHGSQVQGTLPTVQYLLDKSLSTILRIPVTTVGASRTDEGVHALCNYYHFDFDSNIEIDLIYKCNAILPHGIAVKRICHVADEFNARFEATKRRYRYRIYSKKNPFLFQKAMYYPYATDMDKLSEFAGIIKEYDHFESFSKRRAQTKTFTCRIFESMWTKTDYEIQYTVAGNRFLRGMVRGLVGTQLHLLKTGASAQDFRKIIEANNCTFANFDVPGFGLYLEHIEYPEGVLRPFQG
jgi:tRNA pseudouridine38-40 synthase